LLGLSAVFDNISIGTSHSTGNASGDVGFYKGNFVVLDTDSGLGYKTDGRFESLPPQVDVCDLLLRLPAEVKTAEVRVPRRV
jgi:hypothetical protein